MLLRRIKSVMYRDATETKFGLPLKNLLHIPEIPKGNNVHSWNVLSFTCQIWTLCMSFYTYEVEMYWLDRYHIFTICLFALHHFTITIVSAITAFQLWEKCNSVLCTLLWNAILAPIQLLICSDLCSRIDQSDIVDLVQLFINICSTVIIVHHKCWLKNEANWSSGHISCILCLLTGNSWQQRPSIAHALFNFQFHIFAGFSATCQTATKKCYWKEFPPPYSL